MKTLSDALYSLRPNAKWVVKNESELTWNDTEQTQPTEAELTAEVARLQAEYDNNEYQRQRATAYPTIQEQLDMQYWDGVNGTTIWADTVASVKSENPKP
jgi:phosphoglycolate phosphatase-like HAD superfamily hydrolase